MIKKLINPLTQALFEVVLMFTLLHGYITFFVEKPSFFNVEKVQSPIKTKIAQIADKCGSGYPVFWFVMETDKLKNKFKIKNITEYGKFCKKTLEKCDEKYAKIYNLDNDTKDLLFAMETGDVKQYHDLNELDKYQAIKNLINLSEREVYSLSFTVVKNLTDNLIYVFSITDTINNNSCDPEKIKNNLFELSRIARGSV